MQINGTDETAAPAPAAEQAVEDKVAEIDAAVEDQADGPAVTEAPPAQAKSIAEEWADEYDEGAELFCASFDADDFDTEYGDPHPDGTTVAVRRLIRKPPPGWIRQHADMSDMQRTFALLEMHASDKALEILDSLKEKQWDEFVGAWGKDGGLIEGKSRRQRRGR